MIKKIALSILVLIIIVIGGVIVYFIPILNSNLSDFTENNRGKYEIYIQDALDKRKRGLGKVTFEDLSEIISLNKKDKKGGNPVTKLLNVVTGVQNKISDKKNPVIYYKNVLWQDERSKSEIEILKDDMPIAEYLTCIIDKVDGKVEPHFYISTIKRKSFVKGMENIINKESNIEKLKDLIKKAADDAEYFGYYGELAGQSLQEGVKGIGEVAGAVGDVANEVDTPQTKKVGTILTVVESSSDKLGSGAKKIIKFTGETAGAASSIIDKIYQNHKKVTSERSIREVPEEVYILIINNWANMFDSTCEEISAEQAGVYIGNSNLKKIENVLKKCDLFNKPISN